jgi:hypothetical protein
MRLFGLTLPSIAYWSTLFVSAILAIGAAVGTAENMLRRTFSGRGSSLFHYGPSTQKRWLAMYAPVVVLVILGGAVSFWLFVETKSHLFYIVLQLLAYAAGVPLINTRFRRQTEVVRGVSKLLNALGYTVIHSPRTGDTALDALLANLDLLAYDDGRAFAVEVKSWINSAAPVNWSEASNLQMKAKALQHPEVSERLQLPSLTNKDVQPLLILVDRRHGDGLVAFSNEEHVPIETIKRELVDEALATDSQENLVRLAQACFRHLKQSKAESSTEFSNNIPSA